MSPEQRQLELTQARALISTRRKAALLEQQTQRRLQLQEEAAGRQQASARHEFEKEKSAFRKAQEAWRQKAAQWADRIAQEKTRLRNKEAILGLPMKQIIEQLLIDALTRAPAATRRWLKPIVDDAKHKLVALLEAGRWTDRIDESANAPCSTDLQGWSMPRR